MGTQLIPSGWLNCEIIFFWKVWLNLCEVWPQTKPNRLKKVAKNGKEFKRNENIGGDNWWEVGEKWGRDLSWNFARFSFESGS